MIFHHISSPATEGLSKWLQWTLVIFASSPTDLGSFAKEDAHACVIVVNHWKHNVVSIFDIHR